MPLPVLRWLSVAFLFSGLCSAQTDEQGVRALIGKFADSRNAHDGTAAAATYSEDGEYIGTSGQRERGRAALATLWGNIPGQVQRTIQAVDFFTPSLAIVHVVADFTDPVARLLETFVVVKDGGYWNIRIHGATGVPAVYAPSAPPPAQAYPSPTQGVSLTPLNAAMVDDVLRSTSAATRARITFVNQSNTAVDIYWITYDGQRMLYRANLAAGASWEVVTFLTHPWLVVASGTGGTTARDTGVRLAGFEALTPNGDTALIRVFVSK